MKSGEIDQNKELEEFRPVAMGWLKVLETCKTKEDIQDEVRQMYKEAKVQL